jgi:phenylpyruvate tautomerase
MPFVSIESNCHIDQHQTQQLLESLSSTVADALGKPQRYVMVSYRYNPHMLFAGSDKPLAYLELKSIGLPASRCSELSALICRETSEMLHLPAERIYIEFSDAERHMWGWNGSTFAG